MEKTVEELKKNIPFKETTHVGDVVLILSETEVEEAPLGATYALVTGFERDPSKKEEWWFVNMALLTIPPQPQVFILQESHFTGQEIFTMGGRKVFIKALDTDQLKPPADDNDKDPEPTGKPQGGLRVIK